MIFAVDLRFEAPDIEAAEQTRVLIESTLKQLERLIFVDGPFEVAPLVVFEDDE